MRCLPSFYFMSSRRSPWKPSNHYRMRDARQANHDQRSVRQPPSPSSESPFLQAQSSISDPLDLFFALFSQPKAPVEGCIYRVHLRESPGSTHRKNCSFLRGTLESVSEPSATRTSAQKTSRIGPVSCLHQANRVTRPAHISSSLCPSRHLPRDPVQPMRHLR
ncbi:hypothetical protein L226DRAFT_204279 [Lentinus tigrinus ALCF2SS1-7]|uniref:Uncharacterized protein n=1 Tax=Lentinus tigrinus ALCF2SS1-6 TaxID=1328759 RepID=A0A5C2SU95_9APHY|nr:hypothetical protein L227DRAFT_150848 [Lentinus tigrinus ALCF2SS1-6]RPD80580.1 hypothetical protein L226DRAFT_204279 [Lentinus tigrinus ALCF2SS1-7]